jgi:hypothetical protein
MRHRDRERLEQSYRQKVQNALRNPLTNSKARREFRERIKRNLGDDEGLDANDVETRWQLTKDPKDVYRRDDFRSVTSYYGQRLARARLTLDGEKQLGKERAQASNELTSADRKAMRVNLLTALVAKAGITAQEAQQRWKATQHGQYQLPPKDKDEAQARYALRMDDVERNLKKPLPSKTQQWIDDVSRMSGKIKGLLSDNVHNVMGGLTSAPPNLPAGARYVTIGMKPILPSVQDADDYSRSRYGRISTSGKEFHPPETGIFPSEAEMRQVTGIPAPVYRQTPIDEIRDHYCNTQ